MSVSAQGPTLYFGRQATYTEVGIHVRIVITECDHDAFGEEQAVADSFGAELIIAQSRTAEELIENAQGADALVVQYAKITAEILDALPGVRAIGRYGVGVDSVDIAAATERGVAVCNVPDYGTESVSDHAIALALSAAREIPRLDRGVRAGVMDFPGVRPVHLIAGRTFGVIGLGLIGSSTARKAVGLGFNVIAHDALGGEATEFRGFEHTSLDDLVRRSDIISIHTPLTEGSKHLIGAEQFAIAKPGLILVNTSRGPVVDTDALVEALKSGKVRSAALDVSEVEPIPLGYPLLDFPQVTLTPHLGWYSEESYGELKRRTVENVAEVVSGRRPRNVVNPEVLGVPGRNESVE